MKKIFTILGLLLTTSTVLAVPAAAPGFDGEALRQQYKESKEFTPVYKGLTIFAQTGQERGNLPESELKHLADDRANQVCRYFGYEVAGPYTKAMPGFEPNNVQALMRSSSDAYLPTNGALVSVSITKNADSHFFGSIGKVFTSIICFR